MIPGIMIAAAGLWVSFKAALRFDVGDLVFGWMVIIVGLTAVAGAIAGYPP